MPQTVPSAGFTPPCDYSNFAENFDLSLLPPPPSDIKGFAPLPRAYSLFPCSPTGDIDATDFSPNFLITPPSLDDDSRSYLDVFASSPSPFASQSLLSPNPDNKFGGYRQSSEANFYPSSPELSLYTPSPSSAYSQSPRDEYFQDSYVSKAASLSPHRYSPYHRVKEEKFLLSPCAFPPSSPNSCYSNVSSPEAQINSGLHCESDVLDLLEGAVLDKQISDDIRRRIKTEESTVDFGVLGDFQDQPEFKPLVREDLVAEKERGGPKDHQLLRSVLRDTSFQKKFNIRPIDFGFLGAAEIKMEEPDPTAAAAAADTAHSEMMRENIEPVFNLAIEQMRKDVSNTCKALGIAPDPTQWTPANVLSWLEYTSRQFNLSEPIPDQWDMSGAALASLTEEDFTRRSPQGGMILHAQLEIWKAAYSEEEGMPWMLETTSSNASSGDVSDDDDEEASSSQADPSRPTTSRSGGAHIHLWQFLKELLASPQTYGSCIRWLDRAKGIFKIEDSVKVARLWGKRKNRPAMNYDKLSRSIRQYYKKGIMKKTERSQRLVYQFCHPYNL